MRVLWVHACLCVCVTWVQVLTDTEGTDAFDQTAQYSTQIFSLAVLLSSLFVYNQMGGIDESAIDRLSLVMTVPGDDCPW